MSKKKLHPMPVFDVSPVALIILLLSVSNSLLCQYRNIAHRIPGDNEIAVSEPGSYDKPGATYVLVNDISSPRSAVFLGKDVTLDLNGYTITFADGNYGHIPNAGFEEGLKGWDISKAPGAKIGNTAEVHAFIGKKLMHLKAGDEITSGYVMLPEAGRSYFAMCGVTGRYYYDLKGNEMSVSIFVDDENGAEVKCITRYHDTTMMSCPVIGRSPRLGGGFVYAHLNDLPAGKYRIRVRAENDCLVDEIDIRPAMDVGIGIVGQTHPFGHYDHMFNNAHTAFFDYTADASSGEPLPEIPRVEGPGSVVIENGIIRNGVNGIMSWGIQSTAENVRIIIDNVRIISSGINTTAIDVEQATITGCTFDIQNPFIINRHGSEFYAVDLRGSQPSEVSYSEFFGGQGCLCFKGRNTSVHHNFFVNRQTVTNHYSIMAMGDGSRIFENRFEPEIGSGIEIFRKKFIEIFNNEFHITAAPPSCEYADHLSTNGIRIADYGSKPGAADGCYGNRIYNNRFFITGRKYGQYPSFIPAANAIFYSASAGDNEVFGNEITIHQEDPGSDAEAFAFYVGNSRGGKISDNKIVTNVTPVWLASGYGSASNTILERNIFIAGNNPGRLTPIKMGSGSPATGIEFRSNEFQEMDFSVDVNEKPHSYIVFWTLEIKITDKSGKPQPGASIIITEKNGREVFRGTANSNGITRVELPEYSVEGTSRTQMSPYVLKCGRKKADVELNKNISVVLTL